jgi:hypothetical protein
MPEASGAAKCSACADARACVGHFRETRECDSHAGTRVCRPLEPLYGAAMLPLQGESAFVLFGGRASLEQAPDLSECQQKLLDQRFRFQYHRELQGEVTVGIANDTVGVVSPCMLHCRRWCWVSMVI